ncbi:MAG: O-acetylhomoserine aminocarboxypropyltransferase/cysteine synthase [Clostridia bacterium]|nr:O-acetylhomoserine aminocarboxypropyltransferase/cysteine synthase [Clostridia bacterium]
MNIETKCLHAGYTPGNGEPRVLPIYQSTTYAYDSTEHVQGLFDLTVDGHMYSRISNPTVAAVEDKIAALCGGVGALCTTSGQAANLIAILTILKAGDHIVSSGAVYGGTTNLLAVTLARLGIETTFINSADEEAVIRRAFRPNTRLVIGETIANPAITVFDIEKMAAIAHSFGVPLLVDNTFATPILCRPFEYGADIVTHSTTKYMDGHAATVGGVIVDSGRFDWTGGLFPEMTEPDKSYHGVRYVTDFGEKAFITKARVQMMRDIGAYPQATTAFLLNLGLETLPLRMERHCANAQAAAEYLSRHPKVEQVNYPTLPGDPSHELAQKYLPGGCSGVVSFAIRGGRDAAVRFIDSVKLATLQVHVADIRTCVLHPASSTHRQLTDEQLAAAGIHPGMIRLSVGLEHISDILADLEQALSQA